MKLHATAPYGLGGLLVDELRALGAQRIEGAASGATFEADLETLYRVALWSRLANRLLLPLTTVPAASPEQLYREVAAIRWERHLHSSGSLAIDVTQSGETAIGHSRYAVLKCKDAIVDRMRERFGERPSIDTERPDLRLHLHLRRDRARLSIDLSGGSLHRRGYRLEGGAAPLKENLAAAILLLADWPRIAAAGGGLIDPMCGSGTLLIEAAMIAGDVAPGLLREDFGFLRWRGHDPALWAQVVAMARQRREAGLAHLPPLLGRDRDAQALAVAQANLERAGLADRVVLEPRALDEGMAGIIAADTPPGLVVANPPYGERLGEVESLRDDYRRLGDEVARHLPGWSLALFTGNPELATGLTLRQRTSHALHNGPLACRLFLYHPATAAGGGGAVAEFSAGAQSLANRLRKNLKQLGRWAQRQDITCYRLYDADLPEYAVAVDCYQTTEQLHVHVQEYEAPKGVDSAAAARRLDEAMAVIAEVLQVGPSQCHLKVRRRQKGRDQYTRQGGAGRFYEVREGRCRLLVNFTDYLDTGLFLDHRTTRRMIGEWANGRDFLNLFAYTGSATVHAALGGARSTTTVDLSRTYLDWAQRNLALNGVDGPAHTFIAADCTEWLAAEAQARRRRFGLIFLDPPTFSNSKRMQAVFDVQRDHVSLIRQAVALLAPSGSLIFSNNFRRFELDTAGLAGLQIEEISHQTRPEDFRRNPRIHRCWRIGL